MAASCERRVVFVGIGAWSSNELRIPGENLPGVIEAINFLNQNARGDPVPVGKGSKVVVNVASVGFSTQTHDWVAARKEWDSWRKPCRGR